MDAGPINMDSLNVHGKTSDVVIVGLGNSDLDDIATRVAAEQGRIIKPDPTPEKGGFYRSDHFPFAKQGVPALSSRDGIDYVGKPEGYGMQIMKEYIAKHYHKPSDIVRPDWDMSGAVQQLQYYWMVGYRIAEAATYPEWKPGTEFKAKREVCLENHAQHTSAETTVVNLNTTTYEEYIGRGTEPYTHMLTPGITPGTKGWLGNPHPIGWCNRCRAYHTRTECISAFKEDFHEAIRSNVGFKRHVLTLQGKRLGCYCTPQDCHGDVIKEYLESQ